jgi:putative Mg2+ transporter-C (MgtC) family protein
MLHQIDMAVNAWAATLGSPGEGLLKLVVAGLCGGVVGLERELRGRQAGFRTNMLVCMGSALVMVVSTSFATHDWKSVMPPGFSVQVDPARIAYGVMGGVGFLGAGTILQSKAHVRGLTTAAGIWCVAAIGLAVGFGMYLTGIFAALLVMGSLWWLDYVERLLPKRKYRTVVVRRLWQAGCIKHAIEYFKTQRLDVLDVTFEREEDNLTWVNIKLLITFVDERKYFSLEQALEKDDNLQLISTST